MYQSYRLSGKVSWKFFPLTLLSLAVAVPLGSGLCLLLTRAAPGTMWEILAFLVCGGILIEVSCRLCVDMGQVRNRAVAFITGMLGALLFWYLLFAFAAVFFAPGQELDVSRLDGPALRRVGDRFLEVLASPGAVWQEWSRLLREGTSVRGNTGTALIALEGAPLAVITVILCAATVLFTGVCFYAQSTEPFSEQEKRWCRKTELSFGPVLNRQNFMHRLLTGDFTVLFELEPLREVNGDYTLLTLFHDGKWEEFYLTVEARKRKEGSDKGENPGYESEELAEYAAVGREAGRQLLTLAGSVKNGPGAEAGIKKKGPGQIWGVAWRTLFVAGNAVLLAALFGGYGPVMGLLSNGTFLFYAAAAGIVGAVNFLGSFEKRYVVDAGDENFRGALRLYQAREERKPAAYRISYLLMFLMSLLYLYLWIREVIG